MADVLGAKDVQYVAQLARLRLEPDQVTALATQLNDILDYVRQLQAVPTDAIEPTSHVLPLSNVMRPDEVRPSTVAEAVLAAAPSRHGQFFKVPKIIDTPA